MLCTPQQPPEVEISSFLCCQSLWTLLGKGKGIQEILPSAAGMVNAITVASVQPLVMAFAWREEKTPPGVRTLGLLCSSSSLSGDYAPTSADSVSPCWRACSQL